MAYKTIASQRKASRNWYLRNKDKKRKYNKDLNIRYKMKVFEHYSHGKLACDCCEEKIIEFLSIDHINGGGIKHRKMTGSGIAFYRWLINHNFPEGFRVLCMNCNHSYGHFGYCPHNKKG